MSTTEAAESLGKETAWTPTKVQFLYRHLNGRYYVRTFAGGKEKWASLKTTLLTVAKNRMKLRDLFQVLAKSLGSPGLPRTA